MEETLKPGDVLLGGKLSYGAKMPRSPVEVPWANLYFGNNQINPDSIWWSYSRFWGLRRVKKR